MEFTTEAMSEAKGLTPAKEIVAPFAELIPSLEEAASVRRRLGAALFQEADGFEKMIAGYQQAVGIGTAVETNTAMPITVRGGASTERAPGTEDGPRGMEAVRRVMREGGDWNAREIHAELEKRGWVSPDAKFPIRATEAAINRLYRVTNEIEKVGRGRYRYKSFPTRDTLDTGAGGDEG
jgi:hypothetical protein